MTTANDVKETILKSNCFLLMERLGELLDTGNIQEAKEGLIELSKNLRRLGIDSAITQHQALLLAKQVPMPDKVIINDKEVSLKDRLLLENHAVDLRGLEDLWHKCLAGGLEISPVFLWSIWHSLSKCTEGVDWLDSETLLSFEAYEIVSAALSNWPHNKESTNDSKTE